MTTFVVSLTSDCQSPDSPPDTLCTGQACDLLHAVRYYSVKRTYISLACWDTFPNLFRSFTEWCPFEAHTGDDDASSPIVEPSHIANRWHSLKNRTQC